MLSVKWVKSRPWLFPIITLILITDDFFEIIISKKKKLKKKHFLESTLKIFRAKRLPIVDGVTEHISQHSH